MTVEADITTVLKTQCARVFPDFAPMSTTRPYVTYQKIGGRTINLYGKVVPDKVSREGPICNALIQSAQNLCDW